MRVLLNPDGLRGNSLKPIGLNEHSVTDLTELLLVGKPVIAIMDATAANLHQLSAQRKALAKFTADGGWLMLRGLTPEGLADFNQIVGVEHWIRPFVAEDVDLRRGPDGKHPLPLLEGLYSDDVYMKSGMYSTRMPVQTTVAFAAADAWTFVVDLDDIAPWCTLPDPEYWQRDDPQPGSPDDPRNMVNGFTCSWRLGLAIPLEDDQPKRFTITLPAEREIDGFSFANAYSKYFKKTTKLRLGFDSGDPVELTLQAAGGRQDFTFPARTTKTLTVELLEWTEEGAILDVANLWIRPKRTKAFSQKVQPLLNIGVLVKYPMGKGGVILNQMNIVEQETNPANAVKKQRIMDVLLKNKNR